MASKQVIVLVQIKAKEGMEERLKQEILSLVAPTRSEEGCIRYDVHQAADDQSLFMVYETWASKKDMDRHDEMPYFKVYIEKAGNLAAGPPEFRAWELIS